MKLNTTLCILSITFKSGSAFSLLILIEKPTINAHTNRAITFSLESNPVKSSTLINCTVLSKKFKSVSLATSPSNNSLIDVVSPLSTRSTKYVDRKPIPTAITEVTKNMITVETIIFPSLFGCLTLATASEIVKKTRGTIITNIRFKNKSPNGFTTIASSLNIRPPTAPIIMANISKSMVL